MPAAVGDDAERAAVVAAVLHLHEGAGAVRQALDHVRGGFAHAHDVVDADLLLAGHAEVRHAAIGVGGQLLRIAEDEVDLRHGGEGRGLGLRGAAGHDDAPLRMLAARLADRLARLPHRLGR